MNHNEFRMGQEFLSGAGKWRCTDIGTRTIAAIRIDSVTPSTGETLTQSEAESAGWFNGPPYAVVEHIFDEDDLEGCAQQPFEA